MHDRGTRSRTTAQPGMAGTLRLRHARLRGASTLPMLSVMPARSPASAPRAGHLLLALAALAVALLVGPTARASADQAGVPPGAGNLLGYADLGPAHACAVERSRGIRCWGRGASGALGSGALDDRLAAPGTAASSVNLGAVTQVATGDLHACALLSSGAVRCWGQGASGQLGSRDRDNRLDGYADPRTGTDDAATVPLDGAATQISAGGGFTCAVITSGAVRCWGDGLFGRTGARGADSRLDGLADGPSDEATTVPLPGAAAAVSAGDQHACALLTTGSVHCWGYGANGRLGSGATDDRLDGAVDPTSGTDEVSTVPLGAPATAISAGGGHTCALIGSGDVRCWGLGTSGQLGQGRNYESLLDAAGEQPTTVPIKPIGTAANQVTRTPNIKAIAISAGDFHTCAIVEGGDVRCWGQGAVGQLGQGGTDGRLDTSTTAVADAASRVGGGADGRAAGLGAAAVAITAGSSSTCAVLSTGSIRCWGAGDAGRLGSSATDPRLDGAVDAATATDDASIVPIGALPLSATDGLPAPAPSSGGTAGGSAAPGAGTAPQLSATLKLKGRTLTLKAIMAPTKAGTCPKKVGVSVKRGKAKVGKATLKVTKKGTNCRVSGTVRLRASQKKGAVVAIHLSGKGVTARDLTATAK
jgi:alpha-tubulin suppressor-like RCC1 family protein